MDSEMKLFLDVSDRGHYTTRLWCSIKNKKACSEMVFEADRLSRARVAWIIYRSSAISSNSDIRPRVQLSSYYEGIPDLIKAIKRAHDEYLLREYIHNY
jgi:hypothetical protein